MNTMRSEAEIMQELTGIFRQVFNKPDLNINAATTAAGVKEWTSLTHMNLIAEVEASFSLEFSLAEVIAFKNIGDMVAGIQKKLS